MVTHAEPIVGIGITGSLTQPGTVYSVDPMTGSVTAVATAALPGPTAAISSSPIPDTYFIATTANHYLVGYPPNNGLGAALWDSNAFVLTDYAYDPSSGKLFALTPGKPGPAGLMLLTDSGKGLGGFPGSHLLNAIYIAAEPTLPVLSVIEYVPGLGLYGTDGHSAYAINESTGVASALPSLQYAGPIITGLAYDPDSGRLIGVSGSLVPMAGATSDIYDIDPLTGQVTLLNADAPNMFGLADVTAPEPSSLLLPAVGAFFLYLRIRRPTLNGKSCV